MSAAQALRRRSRDKQVFVMGGNLRVQRPSEK
jgi:hypothetical protein